MTNDFALRPSWRDDNKVVAEALGVPIALGIVLWTITTVGCSVTDQPTPEKELPNFLALWNFNEPGETEKSFRTLLPQARESGNTGYHAELLTQLARTQGLQRKFEEAHTTLDEAEALLQDDLVKARIRYLLERGRVFNSSGKPESARPLFADAWDLARSAHEDGLAVDAAHMVAIAENDSPDVALEWNLKALEHAEASSQEGAKGWLGALYNNIAWTYFDRKDYEKSLAIHERALAWRETRGQVQETLIARWSVARLYRALGRVDEAFAVQKQLLEDYTEAGVPPGYVHEELGECSLLLGKPDAAMHFARAYALLSEDGWLVENETDRLQRLKELGKVN